MRFLLKHYTSLSLSLSLSLCVIYLSILVIPPRLFSFFRVCVVFNNVCLCVCGRHSS